MQPIIFVHGAFQGGWVWSRLVPFLPSEQPIYCPTLKGLGDRCADLTPEIGLAHHIADICQIIDDHALSNVLLVGHSYGGMVISGVVKQRSQHLNHIVYLDSVIPQEGESLLDILGKDAAQSFTEAARIHGNGWKVLPLPAAAFGLIHPKDVSWALQKHTPQSLKSFCDPVSIARVEDTLPIRKTYIHCTQSHPFMQSQAQKARSMGWKCVELETPHCPMITHPELLAQTLIELSRG